MALKENKNKIYFECKCFSDEHHLKFQYDADEKEVYVTTFLNDYRNFYQKLVVALKYLFGYKCKYGHWDVFLLKDTDVCELKKFLEDM